MQRIIKSISHPLFNDKNNDTNQDSQRFSLDNFPDELLLKIVKDAQLTLSELASVALVSKHFKTITEDKQFASTPNHIDACVRSLLHDLYHFGVKPKIGFYGQYYTDKALFKCVNQLKSKLLAICKADKFHTVDKETLDTFKSYAIEAFRSTYYSKIGPKLPLISYSANTYNMYADVAENKEQGKLEMIFKISELMEKNDLTIRVRLLLCLYAEVDSTKNSKHFYKYQSLLKATCHRIIATMDNGQLIECREKIKKGIDISRDLNVTKLESAFEAIDNEINLKLAFCSKSERSLIW